MCVFGVAVTGCVEGLDEFTIDPSEFMLDRCRKMDRCLRVLENVSLHTLPSLILEGKLTRDIFVTNTSKCEISFCCVMTILNAVYFIS